MEIGRNEIERNRKWSKRTRRMRLTTLEKSQLVVVWSFVGSKANKTGEDWLSLSRVLGDYRLFIEIAGGPTGLASISLGMYCNYGRLPAGFVFYSLIILSVCFGNYLFLCFIFCLITSQLTAYWPQLCVTTNDFNKRWPRHGYPIESNLVSHLLHNMTRVITKHGMGMKGASKDRDANRGRKLDLLAIKETVPDR